MEVATDAWNSSGTEQTCQSPTPSKISYRCPLAGAKTGSKTTAGSGDLRALGESRLKGGCSQDWLPH
jgi:hypothetical protein